MRSFVVLLTAVGCVALVSRPPGRQLHQNDLRPVLLRPALARTVSKPFLPMLVDLLWLRALNAIGLRDSEAKNRALYEYGVAITELDPRFKLAYEYIGLSIPFAAGRNKWVGGELSSDLYRRGLLVFPQDVRLHMYLGFSLYYYERKFTQASDVYAAAARLPGALPYFAPFATRLKAHSGAAEDALDLARALLAEDLEDAVREELEERVIDLEVEVVLQRVDRAVRAFQERTGRLPASLAEIRAQQLYDGPDVDTQGGFITIDKDGKATSTSLERRMLVYE